MTKNSIVKIIIVFITIIVGCCLGLFFIMKYEKTSDTTNNSSSNTSNNTDKNTETNIDTTSAQTINRNYEYIEDTDVFKPKNAFGWGKPIITNYAWESGMFYEAYRNVDGVKAYNEYKEYLINKGYTFQNEKQDGDAKIYTYEKNDLTVIFRIQSKMFEITLSK